ncbi:MAG: class I SAM-dependent methyltransferase [Deltaproteobacteria bacterium]|nr:class I SAM-dependent methyltransferase [Deltaproteobacteria bacterium]
MREKTPVTSRALLETAGGMRPCRICASLDYTPVYYIDEVEISRCNRCDFIQIASVGSLSILNAHYSSCGHDGPDLRSNFDKLKIIRAAGFRADYFMRHTGLTGGEVLEIGASEGHFLDELRGRGFNVTGVEPSRHGLKAVEKGLHVHRDMLENVALKDAHYDAICLFQVIEHFEDPLGVLRLLYSKLKAGGCLVVETPDIYSVGSKFEKTPWKLFNVEHITYFSQKSLDELLKAAGFKIIASRHCDYDGLRLPFAKMLKRVVVPLINPGFKGPLQKILAKEIDIRYRTSDHSRISAVGARQGAGGKRLRDIKKMLAAPFDILMSNIAYALDRGSSVYSVARK